MSDQAYHCPKCDRDFTDTGVNFVVCPHCRHVLGEKTPPTPRPE